MTLPKNLLAEAEEAADKQFEGESAWMLRDGFSAGVHWLFTRLCEMSEGEIDEDAVRQESYRREEEQTEKHGEEFLDTFSFIEGARHQHSLDMAALLRQREEIARLSDLFKRQQVETVVQFEQLEAERARAERLGRALREIARHRNYVHSARPSLQQERSLEEQSIIQEIIERSPFKASPTLHADYVQKKIQEMDMDEKPDATAREWIIKKEENQEGYYEDVDGPNTGTYEHGIQGVHVIEKSAYDALKARVAYLEKQLADLDTSPSDFQVIEALVEREQKLVSTLEHLIKALEEQFNRGVNTQNVKALDIALSNAKGAIKANKGGG